MSQRMSQSVTILLHKDAKELRIPESPDADVETRITRGLWPLSSLPVHVSSTPDLRGGRGERLWRGRAAPRFCRCLCFPFAGKWVG